MQPQQLQLQQHQHQQQQGQQQQQQYVAQQNSYDPYYNWNAVENQQFREQSAYNPNFSNATTNSYFSINQPSDNNNSNVEFVQQRQQSSVYEVVTPQQAQFEQSSEYSTTNYSTTKRESFASQTSAFSPVNETVYSSRSVADSFIPTPKQQTPQPEQNLNVQNNVPSTAQYFNAHATDDTKEEQQTLSASEGNQWGAWGDDSELDLEDGTVGAMYCRDDDDVIENEDVNPPTENKVVQQQSNVAAPDLVAISQSAPDNQPIQYARELQYAQQQAEERTPRKAPDLFSGHEHNAVRNDPDVVSRYDTAQADLLEDVCLDERENINANNNNNYENNAGLVDTVSKWSKKIINTLAAEADNTNYVGLNDDTFNLNQNFAPLSFASGMVHHHQPPVMQQRSRSSSTVSATSPKLGV